MKKQLTWFPACLAICALPACKEKAPDAPTATTTPATAKVEAAPAPNAELVALVKTYAAHCTISVEQGQAYGCKPAASGKMSELLHAKKPAEMSVTP